LVGTSEISILPIIERYLFGMATNESPGSHFLMQKLIGTLVVLIFTSKSINGIKKYI